MGKTVIVTPAYCTQENNRIGLLEKTIKSVSAQGSGAVHLIVDDGSPLSCEGLVRRMSKDDPNIRYFRRKKGVGERETASNAINTGIEMVFGGNRDVFSEQESHAFRYLVLLHSDDILAPRSIDAISGGLNEEGVGATYSNKALFNDRGVFDVSVYGDFRGFGKLKDAIWERGLRTHTISWDLNFLDKIRSKVGESYGFTEGVFDPELGCGEDRDAALHTVNVANESGVGVKYIDKVTLFYRCHEQSITGEVEGELIERDRQRIRRRHGFSDNNLTAFIPLFRRLVTRPHSFLPENVKRYLRPIRDFGKKEFVTHPEYDDFIKDFI